MDTSLRSKSIRKIPNFDGDIVQHPCTDKVEMRPLRADPRSIPPSNQISLISVQRFLFYSLQKHKIKKMEFYLYNCP